MKIDVHRFIAHYVVCQQNKYSTLAPSGLLQPHPLSNRIWDEVSMDFIEGLPYLKVLTLFWWFLTVSTSTIILLVFTTLYLLP